MSKEDKYYSPQEVAAKILETVHNRMKKSELFKNNTSHEIELGQEPNNDDAEAPEYLADANIEDDYKEDESRKGKKKKSGDNIDESDPEHEQGMDASEEKEHDAAENEADEEDADNIEADEELEEDDADMKETKKIISDAASDNDKKKMDKSEDASDNKVKEMSSEEDLGLDKPGEYERGNIANPEGGKRKREANKAEDIGADLKKPGKHKLKQFMKKRKMRGMEKNKKVEKYLGTEQGDR